MNDVILKTLAGLTTDLNNFRGRMKSTEDMIVIGEMLEEVKGSLYDDRKYRSVFDESLEVSE